MSTHELKSELLNSLMSKILVAVMSPYSASKICMLGKYLRKMFYSKGTQDNNNTAQHILG
jgi:hypothetical protein